MRAFIAIEVPAAVKEALAACGQELRRLPAEGSWPKPGNLHLTLKFLGEVPETSRAAIVRAMAEAAAGRPAFWLALDGLGAFPNVRRPRVLWVGLGGDVAAARGLQASLEERLAAAGFPREERAFAPHLTLARLRSVADPRRFEEGVRACRVPGIEFAVRRIALFRSELHPWGARYEELAWTPLAADGPAPA